MMRRRDGTQMQTYFTRKMIEDEPRVKKMEANMSVARQYSVRKRDGKRIQKDFIMSIIEGELRSTNWMQTQHWSILNLHPMCDSWFIFCYARRKICLYSLPITSADAILSGDAFMCLLDQNSMLNLHPICGPYGSTSNMLITKSVCTRFSSRLRTLYC